MVRNNFHAASALSATGLTTFNDEDASRLSQRNLPDARTREEGPTAGEIAYWTSEVRDLRAEADRLRVERDRLLAVQHAVLDLLHTTNADRLIHDLRNVLNERELYKALVDATCGE